MAFEPNPQLIPNLRRTAAGAGNVVVHNLALSDQNADASLFVPVDHSMATLADRTGRLGMTTEESCRMQRLDDFEPGLFHPDFIKCDVEGAELQVFRGARRILDRQDAPIILYEAGINTVIGFGLGRWEATDFLTALDPPNFSLFAISEGGALLPLDRETSASVNVLAVPCARLHRISRRHGTLQ